MRHSLFTSSSSLFLPKSKILRSKTGLPIYWNMLISNNNAYACKNNCPLDQKLKTAKLCNSKPKLNGWMERDLTKRTTKRSRTGTRHFRSSSGKRWAIAVRALSLQDPTTHERCQYSNGHDIWPLIPSARLLPFFHNSLNNNDAIPRIELRSRGHLFFSPFRVLESFRWWEPRLNELRGYRFTSYTFRESIPSNGSNSGRQDGALIIPQRKTE